MTIAVQNHAGDNAVHPSSSSKVSAAGHKTAPQVVEDLPLRQHRKRVRFAASFRTRHVPPQPP